MYLSGVSEEESLNRKDILAVHVVPVSRHRQAGFKAQESDVVEAVLARRFRHAALPATLQPHPLDLATISNVEARAAQAYSSVPQICPIERSTLSVETDGSVALTWKSTL